MGLIPTYKTKKVNCKLETCEKTFHQINSLHPFCSPKCKIEYSRSKQAKKVNPKPLKKVTPIRKQSLKRAEQNKEYLKLRKVFLKDNPKCQCKGCEFKSQDVHHKFDGSDRQKYFLDVSTWLAVCMYCHNWIHEHSIESKQLGYLK